MEEWAAICKKTLPDWKKAVLLVETLAEEYKAACAGLLAMHDTLQAVRAEIGEMVKAQGYAVPLHHRREWGGRRAPTSGDSVSLLDKLADGADIEGDVIEQVWQRELHDALVTALREVPEGARGIISRHYFGGMSIGRMAQEYGITRQAVYDREQKAFQTIRAGRYGAELAEFMPSMNRKERAERWIERDRAAVARLQLSDMEKELLAL